MDGAESRSKGCHVGVFESYCALEVAITGKESVDQVWAGGLSSAPGLENRAMQTSHCQLEGQIIGSIKNIIAHLFLDISTWFALAISSNCRRERKLQLSALTRTSQDKHAKPDGTA
jgi:hypothetical protein